MFFLKTIMLQIFLVFYLLVEVPCGTPFDSWYVLIRHRSLMQLVWWVWLQPPALFWGHGKKIPDLKVFVNADVERAVCLSVHQFGPNWNISTIGWLAMTFCADIHGPLGMNATDFHDPLTFPIAPPWSSKINDIPHCLHAKLRWWTG